MSKKGNQGHGTQAPVPAPLAEPEFHPEDPARVDPPAHDAEPEPAPLGPTRDDGAVAPPFVEPFEPSNGIPPVTAKDRENAAMAEPIEPEAPAVEDPQRRGKPLPDGAVMVEALRGVIVRVQHREPGEKFWLYEAEARDFVDRGWVKRLEA